MLLSFALVFWACDSDDKNKSDDDPQGSDLVLSENGKLQYLGGLQLNDSLHEMEILGNDLYGIRDKNLFRINLASPENISVTKQKSFSGDMGALVFEGNQLFTLNRDYGKLYEMDLEFNVQKEYSIDPEYFIPTSLFIDGETFWIGGSNGSNGALGKFTMTHESLVLEEIWVAPYSQSDLVSLAQKDEYILASAANGVLLVFEKDNIENGSPQQIVFEGEPGHEAWGKTLLINGNKAYWANWGAGLAVLDLSNMESVVMESFISNSDFKNQFPNSDGISAYDIAYNSAHHLLCIANGWGGVFLVNPDNPTEVVDYLDINDVQNYSVATKGNYIYTGNISGGISGQEKGVKIYKIRQCSKKKAMGRIFWIGCMLIASLGSVQAQVVFETTWKSDADMQVYITEWKSDADLWVYKTDSKSDAQSKEGFWFFTTWKSDAKKQIIFTTWKSDADLVIYYTEWKSDAGWKNEDKKSLFD